MTVGMTWSISEGLGGGLMFLQLEPDMLGVLVPAMWFSSSSFLNANGAIHCNGTTDIFQIMEANTYYF